jgi:AcrR family transcriptional regulator/transposase-like protein
VPKTVDSHILSDAAAFEPFGDEAACLAWLWRSLYAPDGVSAICKQCRTLRRFHRVGGRRAYACDSCGHHVYPTVGTFMESSRLSVATWFTGAMLIRAGEEPVTAEALARRLSVNYKTALRMKKKILAAGRDGGPDEALLGRLQEDAGAARDGDGDEDGSRRGRSSRARDTIRAAACRAFAAHGLPATRISDIAREAGVSNAVVRYYYRSKDDILLAALQWAMEQTYTRIDELREETADSVRRLRGILELSLPAEGRLHDEILLWLEVWVRIRFHPELLTACVAMSDYWLSFVREAIEDGERAGVFHPVAPAAELAQWFVALADGLSFRSAVGYTGMHVRRVTEVLLEFAARQLGVPVEELTG